MIPVYMHLLEPLHFPLDNKYNYIVRTIASTDGGQTYFYAGICKYFDTRQHAEDYLTALESMTNETQS